MSVQIEEIEGDDLRLFPIVGPLVMNPKVLAYNNNYPFKTSTSYIWFIAMCEGAVCGFVPVKRSKSGWLIDNYYDDHNTEVLDLLIRHIVSVCASDVKISAVVHQAHRELFASQAFQMKIEWTKYFKMEREAVQTINEEKCDGQIECV